MELRIFLWYKKSTLVKNKSIILYLLLFLVFWEVNAFMNIMTIQLNFDDNLDKSLLEMIPDIFEYRILSESLDAIGANRGKKPLVTYKIEYIKFGESFTIHSETFKKIGPLNSPPIIIGTGPAGLFAALRFAEYGIPTLIFERGDKAFVRMKKIARFWRHGELDEESNVCFGEGGAGLFSDGKLITRVKSPYVSYVMQKLVFFGAPKETAYISNPHLGSNKIRGLIEKMGAFLTQNGHKIFYRSKVSRLLIKNKKIEGVELEDGKVFYSNAVILATGHSSRDIYEELQSQKVSIRPKNMAIGVRMEHPRTLIDRIQYGNFCSHPKLGASRYRLSAHNKKTERGIYSFCMCPGGYVLSSGTEKDGLVTNGMSNFSRSSPWSNAAIVVSVKANLDFEANPLSGLSFIRKIEQKAFNLSLENKTPYRLPAQNLADFMKNKKSTQLHKGSSPSKTFSHSIDDILSPVISDHLREGFEAFAKQMKGPFIQEGLLYAPETRTSAPVTILRNNETLESENIEGLYPAGEGAGYAGGITSAAVDGVKIAEKICQRYQR